MVLSTICYYNYLHHHRCIELEIKVNPRRPYYSNQPYGYMESDKDYVLNNLDLCVEFLTRRELIMAGRTRKREKRIAKEAHRKGTKKAHQGGWAARQAGKK